MTDVQFQTLIDMLPPQVRFWVLSALQVLAALSIALPLLERLAKLTPSKSDDEALTVVQRVLSIIPRAKLDIPRLSQRPTKPATTDKLQVQWPSADKLPALVAQEPPKPPPAG